MQLSAAPAGSSRAVAEAELPRDACAAAPHVAQSRPTPTGKAKSMLPYEALPAAHGAAAIAAGGAEAAQQGAVFSDEQQGFTFLAPAPSMFAKSASTLLSPSSLEHSSPLAISNPIRESNIRSRPQAFSSKGGTDTLKTPRSFAQAHSFSGAGREKASPLAAFAPHAHSAADMHDATAASLQLHQLHSSSMAGSGPPSAGPELPFAWQDGPLNGTQSEENQGQPVGEANEQSHQQGDDHAADHNAAHQQSLDFHERSLMSMMLPSDATHKRYAFLFGDTVKEGSMHFDHWWLLIANPLNFSHKVACAAVLGVYGLTAKSWEQLGILIALQGIMLIYLLLAWPYLQWQLQVLELVAHALEAVIIIFGILQMDGSSEAYMTWVMIGCFFGVILLLLVYELWRLCSVLIDVVDWLKERCSMQSKVAPSV
uniref:Uncharacterized protein n=1 Tax=Dunaliella tertiolecta TaxID=3047 RepID=A0A7S3R1R0_DUNTE|mmetsp:Transcript_24553/g.66948  ORF Transcript_24553/g.66948 Transcript_24553/m.66948 type:complete len:426 (-) Transcript_24553:417-1694(-)